VPSPAATSGRPTTDVITIEIAANVEQIDVAGGVVAEGVNSGGVRVRGDTVVVDGLSIRATYGEAIARTA
jgi:hypothetical protein